MLSIFVKHALFQFGKHPNVVKGSFLFYFRLVEDFSVAEIDTNLWAIVMVSRLMDGLTLF